MSEEITKKRITVGMWSNTNHGIATPDKSWYNMERGLSDKEKDKIVEKMIDLRKGDIIELHLKDSMKQEFRDFDIIEKGKGQTQSRGDIVPFDDILKEAHRVFNILSIDTHPVLKPDGNSVIENGWMVIAEVKVRQDNDVIMSTGIGDATTDNVKGADTQKALPRMAETRAIGRALRWLLAKKTIEEEMPEEK